MFLILLLIGVRGQCNCSQLLSLNDCTGQWSTLGCIWIKSYCAPLTCSVLPQNMCIGVGNCWLTSDGTCSGSMLCNLYNSTVTTSGCTSIPGCNTSLIQNSDKSYPCVASSPTKSPICNQQSTNTTCLANSYCRWNTTVRNACSDVQCSDRTNTTCTYSFNSVTLQSTPCWVNPSGKCQVAPNYTVLDAGSCNTNTNNMYTWTGSECALCGTSSWAYILMSIIYILL